MIEKIVGINGFDLEVPISEHMAFFTYEDRPGVIGTVGRLLGEADINIAGMQVARDRAGGKALVALTVDSAIPAGVVGAIATEIGASEVHGRRPRRPEQSPYAHRGMPRARPAPRHTSVVDQVGGARGVARASQQRGKPVSA